jgi:hypothetical protein
MQFWRTQTVENFQQRVEGGTVRQMLTAVTDVVQSVMGCRTCTLAGRMCHVNGEGLLL